MALPVTIFFLLAGQPFIGLLGIQNDEALFAGPIYEPPEALHGLAAAGITGRFQSCPCPIFGSLKTLIYTPILKLFGNGAYAVREPPLIVGAAGVWLFFLLLRRVSGDRGSIVGCCLPAADSLYYLLTTCYDWGRWRLQIC